MALIQSKWATRQHNTATAACAGIEVAQLFEYTTVAGKTLAAGDIIELGVLPAYNSISDAILICDAVGTGFAFDVGVMSDAVGDNNPARTSGAEVFAAAPTGAAGGVLRASLPTAFTLAAMDADRSIGVKVTTAAGTQAAGAKIRLMLKYRAI